MFKTVKIKEKISYDKPFDLVGEILSDSVLKALCLFKEQSTNFTYEYLLVFAWLHNVYCSIEASFF